MYTKMLSLQARSQWQENYGYCGETSLIAASLYYGQYFSQYQVRSLASPGVSQASQDSQLLVSDGGRDDNSVKAAKAMLLGCASWPADSETNTHDFLAWIKQQIVAGFPVVIGVLMNASKFPDDPCDQADYDHIVPVYGIASNHPLSDPSYYDEDVIYFYDNGLYPPMGPPTFECSSRFDEFQKDRQDANQLTAAPYSLAIYDSKPRGNPILNYGIAITGIIPGDATLPVRVVTSPNGEPREIAEHYNTKPPPTPLALTVTVTGLEPGVAYSLYRYSAPADVAMQRPAKIWPIPPASNGASSLTETGILSDTPAIYRAVVA